QPAQNRRAGTPARTVRSRPSSTITLEDLVGVTAAWSKIGTSTKTARQFSAERINQATAAVGRTLDGAAPAFAPFAHRWDAEADRRMALRTPENLKALIEAQRANTSARATAATAASQRKAARKASRNPLNGARRAAATADKARSEEHTSELQSRENLVCRLPLEK